MVQIVPFVQDEDEFLAPAGFVQLGQGVPHGVLRGDGRLRIGRHQILEQQPMNAPDVLPIGAAARRRLVEGDANDVMSIDMRLEPRIVGCMQPGEQPAAIDALAEEGSNHVGHDGLAKASGPGDGHILLLTCAKGCHVSHVTISARLLQQRNELIEDARLVHKIGIGAISAEQPEGADAVQKKTHVCDSVLSGCGKARNAVPTAPRRRMERRGQYWFTRAPCFGFIIA